MRAFLGVTVAQPALSAYESLLAKLQTAVVGVQWVRSRAPHVTLRFFEELDASHIEDLMSSLGARLSKTPTFNLELAGAGAFPNASRPRVLWLGTDSGSDQLADVFKLVDDAVATAGLGREARAFASHCTLGRVRGRWQSGDAWEKFCSEPTRLPLFRVAGVDLYEVRGGYHLAGHADFAGI